MDGNNLERRRSQEVKEGKRKRAGASGELFDVIFNYKKLFWAIIHP